MLVDVDDGLMEECNVWKEGRPCCAARMEVAINATMCSIVNPSSKAGKFESGNASGDGVLLGFGSTGGWGTD